jgi:DNA-binding XRE family transcriptional regulator
MITAAQCRMARAGLRWDVRQLAEKAGVSPATIVAFEKERRSPMRSTNAAIQRTFEAAGVEFTNGAKPGVRLGQV